MSATFATEAFMGRFISAPWRSSGKSMVSMGLATFFQSDDPNTQFSPHEETM